MYHQITGKGRGGRMLRVLKANYAWVVLFLSFLALLSAQGVRLSFGAFIEPWEQQFAAGRSLISFIALISFIVYGISQPIIGKVIDSFGIRRVFAVSILIVGVSTLLTYFVVSAWHLVLLYGILASVGFGGASGITASVAVTNWFQKKKGFALGLITAGSAAGQLVLVPMSLLLIEAMGWKQTVILLGTVLTLVIFPLILFLLRDHPGDLKATDDGGDRRPERKEEETKEKGIYRRAMMTSEFWFLAIPYFICGFTTTGLMDTHLIPFAQFCGFSVQTTGAAVSLLAAFNILGTLLSGYIADRFRNNYFLAFLYGVRGITVCCLLFIDEPFWLLAFAIVFGLVDFATVAPTTLLATRYFQSRSIGVILGCLYMSHQVGSALGAYLPGLFFDLTGRYESSFLTAAILLGAASILSFFLDPAMKKRGNLPPSIPLEEDGAPERGRGA